MKYIIPLLFLNINLFSQVQIEVNKCKCKTEIQTTIEIPDTINTIDITNITDITDSDFITFNTGIHTTWNETALHGTVDYLNSQFILDLGIRYKESKTETLQGFYRTSLELSPFDRGNIHYGPRISYSSFNKLSAGVFVRYRIEKFEWKIYYNEEFKILIKYYL